MKWRLHLKRHDPRRWMHQSGGHALTPNGRPQWYAWWVPRLGCITVERKL